MACRRGRGDLYRWRWRWNLGTGSGGRLEATVNQMRGGEGANKEQRQAGLQAQRGRKRARLMLGPSPQGKALYTSAGVVGGSWALEALCLGEDRLASYCRGFITGHHRVQAPLW